MATLYFRDSSDGVMVEEDPSVDIVTYLYNHAYCKVEYSEDGETPGEVTVPKLTFTPMNENGGEVDTVVLNVPYLDENGHILKRFIDKEITVEVFHIASPNDLTGSVCEDAQVPDIAVIDNISAQDESYYMDLYMLTGSDPGVASNWYLVHTDNPVFKNVQVQNDLTVAGDTQVDDIEVVSSMMIDVDGTVTFSSETVDNVKKDAKLFFEGLKDKVLITDAQTGEVIPSDATTTELSYLTGAQSNIQTQLNNTPRLVVPSTTRFYFSGSAELGNYTGMTNNDYAFVLQVVPNTSPVAQELYLFRYNAASNNWNKEKLVFSQHQWGNINMGSVGTTDGTNNSNTTISFDQSTVGGVYYIPLPTTISFTTLTVSGNAEFGTNGANPQNTVTVYGAIKANNINPRTNNTPVEIGGELVVDNDTTVKGDLTVGTNDAHKNLHVTGTSQLDGDVTVSNDVDIAGTLNIDVITSHNQANSVTIQDALAVIDSITGGNGLTINDKDGSNNNISLVFNENGLNVNAPSSFDENVVIDKNLTVGTAGANPVNIFTVNGNSTTNGNVSTNGNLTQTDVTKEATLGVLHAQATDVTSLQSTGNITQTNGTTTLQGTTVASLSTPTITNTNGDTLSITEDTININGNTITNINGNTTITGTTSISDAVTIGSNSSVSNNTLLTVNGKTSLKNDVTIASGKKLITPSIEGSNSGILSILTPATVTGDLTASGTSSGNVLTATTNVNTPKITGTGVGENISPLEIAGSTKVTGKLTVTNDADLVGTTDVDDLNISGTISHTGATATLKGVTIVDTLSVPSIGNGNNNIAITSDVDASNKTITASTFVGSLNGNASTASKIQNAVNIGTTDSATPTAHTSSTVAFDGHEGILIPLPATITATLLGNADTATVASKLTTSDVGSKTTPIYLDDGVAKASDETVGSSVKPIFLNGGALTASDGVVGASDQPIFMSNGTLTASSSSLGGATQPIYMDAGVFKEGTALQGGAYKGVDTSIGSSPSNNNVPTTAAVASFVNSSISSQTGTLIGTFDAETDLGLTVDPDADPPIIPTNAQISAKLGEHTFSTTPSNNDYCYVTVDTVSSTPSIDEFRRFKYSQPNPPTAGTWVYEYTLNNSSFTDAQWKAINSGIEAPPVAPDPNAGKYGISISGNANTATLATTATKLSSSAGDTSTPVYFTNGVPSTVSKVSVSLIDVATTSTNGLLSSTDKTKLDTIATGAEVNVQSDWSVTDNTSDAFIKNKPTIGDKILTIYGQNGSDSAVSAQTFGANQSDENKSVTIKASNGLSASTSSNTITISNSGVRSITDATSGDGIITVNTNGSSSNITVYTLPTATDATLGGVKVGTDLSISNGVLSQSVISRSDPTTTETALTEGSNFTVLDGLTSSTTGHVTAVASRKFTLPATYTPSSHTHGNITNDGKVGTTANLPLVTTTGGAVTAGSVTSPIVMNGTAIEHATSGVTVDSGTGLATYTKVTVNAKGHVTAGTSLSSSDVGTAIGASSSVSGQAVIVDSNGNLTFGEAGKVDNVTFTRVTNASTNPQTTAQISMVDGQTVLDMTKVAQLPFGVTKLSITEVNALA